MRKKSKRVKNRYTNKETDTVEEKKNSHSVMTVPFFFVFMFFPDIYKIYKIKSAYSQ